MAYWDFKDIKRRIASDKIFRDKAFNIAKNSKYDGYQRGLASMVYKFLIKSPLHLQINSYQGVVLLIIIIIIIIIITIIIIIMIIMIIMIMILNKFTISWRITQTNY